MYTLEMAQEQGWGERAEAFRDWMNELDRYVSEGCGVGVDDLPDQDFAAAFESGLAPEEFGEEMLAEMGID